MEWSLSTCVLVAVTSFVAQTVKGITGFGAGLVMMPLLMTLLPPAEAILLQASVDLVAGGWLAKNVIGLVSRPLIVVIVATTSIGQVAGTQILFAIEPRRTAWMLGILVFVMGLRFTLKPVSAGRGELEVLPDEPRYLVYAGMAGVLAGMMGGTVGAGGPPLIAYVRYHFADAYGRAHLIVVLFFGSIVVTSLLLVQGADPWVLQATPLLLLPGLVGSRAGAWFAPRASREAFGRATGIVLLLSAVALLVR